MAKERKREVEPSVNIAARISAATHRHLLDVAKKDDRTPSWIVRKAIEDWLNRHKA